MSLTLEVSLLSGKTASLQTHEGESVESLRVQAQGALGAGKGRLLDSTGCVLDGGAHLKEARLQYVEPPTFQVRRSIYVAAVVPLLRSLEMVRS